jgi:hypothetical protein
MGNNKYNVTHPMTINDILVDTCTHESSQMMFPKCFVTKTHNFFSCEFENPYKLVEMIDLWK